MDKITFINLQLQLKLSIHSLHLPCSHKNHYRNDDILHIMSLPDIILIILLSGIILIRSSKTHLTLRKIVVITITAFIKRNMYHTIAL